MLAGIGGIDLVVLVVAADESVMPQTREHFEICRLLGIRRGVIALTKADLVDEEILELVNLEVEEFVAGSFLAAAPVIPVSSSTGEGLPELQQAMAAAARATEPRVGTGLLRLPVDRVFTMKGFGTVVTGTLSTGTLQVDDQVENPAWGPAGSGPEHRSPRPIRGGRYRWPAHRCQSRGRAQNGPGARGKPGATPSLRDDQPIGHPNRIAAVGEAAQAWRPGSLALGDCGDGRARLHSGSPRPPSPSGRGCCSLRSAPPRQSGDGRLGRPVHPAAVFAADNDRRRYSASARGAEAPPEGRVAPFARRPARGAPIANPGPALSRETLWDSRERTHRAHGRTRVCMAWHCARDCLCRSAPQGNRYGCARWLGWARRKSA